MSNKSTRTIPLVRTFMTHEMGDEDIAALSTGREEEFRRIMDAIARSLKGSPGSLQHVVLYGSRGFGKSFMTRRVQIAVSELDPAKGRVVYVLLPEEQHNLQRSPHAFLDALGQNLRNLETSGDAAFEEGHFQWPQRDEGAKQWNEAADRLEETIEEALGKAKGLIVVVVENFDTLLATLFGADEAEQRLRLWLDRPKNRLMLLATATGTVDINYDRPLFKAFEPVRLTPWSGDDCIAYFNKLRDREGKPHLTPAQEAKGRAIADFIGGTPRLAQLLAEVIDTQDALTVAETMSALADKLAEYYRRRIEDLPPLARGLLDALIRGGEPASQTELARRVGARGQSDIARVMSDLQRADVIRGRRSPDSRETLYSVTDRVFVHYYRLRQGSRAVRTTPLATILEFLKSFYSRDEQREQALIHLDAGRPAEADLFSSLALEGQELLDDPYTAIFARRLQSYLSGVPTHDVALLTELSARMESEPAQAFEACKEGSGDGSATSTILKVLQAQAMLRLGAHDRAEAILLSAVQSAKDPFVRAVGVLETWFFYKFIKSNEGKGAEVAVQLYPAILGEDISQDVKIVLLPVVAISLIELDRYSEAYELLEWMLEFARNVGNPKLESLALKQRVIVASLLKNFEILTAVSPEAIENTRRAGDSAGEVLMLTYRTRALRHIGDLEGAIVAADATISAADAAGNLEAKLVALTEKVEALLAAGKYKQVVKSALVGVKVARESGAHRAEVQLLIGLAQAQNNLNRYDLGRDAALSALKLAEEGDSRTQILARLALLLPDIHFGNYEDAWQAICEIRAAGVPQAALTASVLASIIGTQIVKPEVVSWYASTLDEWDHAFPTETWSNSDLSPWAFLDNVYAAAVMAGTLNELDKIMAKHKDKLIASRFPVRFSAMDGAVIAKVGRAEGRASGYRAAAEFLPRVADLMEFLSPELRDDAWLPTLITGFATECRDPGLLRDVADLLTTELSPDAEASANLLRQLAAVDEASDPEISLARLDPDTATVIRRLRKLPDVPSEKPKPTEARRKGRRRKTR